MLNQNLLLTGDNGYNLTKSLRFRQSAGGNLSKTFASAGNQKTWTLSFWTKRGKLSYSNDLMGCYAASNDSGNFEARFSTSDQFQVVLWNYLSTTNAVFRDPSAWYHVVLVIDTTQAGTSSGSKVKVYINGVLQSWSSDGISANIAQNTNLAWNGTTAQYFCRWYASDGGGYYYDGEYAELNFIDGQALTPSSFGSTNSLTGVWQPAKYTGTYGTNGFYLPFTNTTSTTTLGYDFSGNSNNWTTNNLSLTTGSTYDSMTDVPTLTSATTANYCVLNPLDQYSNVTLTNGNLSGTFSSYIGFVRGTMALPSTGKWYWEGTVPTSDVRAEFGIATFSQALGVDPQTAAGCWFYYSNGTNTYKYSAGTATLWGSAWVSGDIIGIAFDADAGTLTYYKNGTLQGGGVATTGLTGTYVPMLGFGNNTSTAISMNFGQQPFAQTPPTGFVALNTYNLPTSTIVKGNTVMDATLYTGNSGTQSIVNTAGFKPDFVWLKSRSNALNHNLFDSVRGVQTVLATNSTGADNYAGTGELTAFNSNGFTLVNSGTYQTNQSTYTYDAWQWQAGQGTNTTNTAGSITSTVSANPTAGFSVVTYTGTGANATVGHGLGVAPKMIIFKVRSNGTYGWYCYNASIGATNHLVLNTTAASSSSSFLFNDTAPTSSVMTVGTSAGTNQSGETYVAYCWSEVAGFSKFGSYTGNGSSDGTFVYLGFRPKFVMIKRTSSTGGWVMLDTSRDPYNDVDNYLYADSSAADAGSSNVLDINSNGFKIRNSWTDINGSGSSYIYMAFAENSFKNALAR